MTEKQNELLKKYLDIEHIEILDKKGFDAVSNFISLIFNTDNRDCCLADVVLNSIEISQEEKELIENYVNNNNKDYSGPNDEYYKLNSCTTILNSSKKYYSLQQTWCKGMSESYTYNFIVVTSDFKESKIMIFQELMDLGIFNLKKLLFYLKNMR